MADRIPGAGPWPTPDEVAAARERLALHPAERREAVAAAAIVHRLVRAHEAGGPVHLAALLLAAEASAERHGDCRTTGCAVCLYLADAVAIAEALRDPDGVDPSAAERALWGVPSMAAWRRGV